MHLKGKAWTFGEDVDTDVIIPAKYLNTSDPKELASHVMEGAGPEFAARIFYRNAFNIGLPIVECPGIADGVEQGDEIEIDAANGKIKNLTKGTEFSAKPIPEFMQELINKGGLVKWTKEKIKA